MQIATVLAEHGARLVPDVAVTGASGGNSLGDAMVARLLSGVGKKTPVTAAHLAG